MSESKATRPFCLKTAFTAETPERLGARASFMWSIPGYDRYYNKYINVKKGGIGGVAMVLAGYVVLSYVWGYDHISKKRLHAFIIQFLL